MTRLPSKAERRALLRDRGWTRISAWRDEWHGDEPFTLSAAYRLERAGVGA